eukprot:14362474-Alexandrium_andersonii.AAC.1
MRSSPPTPVPNTTHANARLGMGMAAKPAHAPTTTTKDFVNEKAHCCAASDYTQAGGGVHAKGQPTPAVHQQ